VKSVGIQTQAEAIIVAAEHQPTVEVRPEWYY
jgi:hypothetical protein